MQYMAGALTFIVNMLKTSTNIGLCPFQLDVAIAVGKPEEKQVENDSSGADDESDDEEEEDEKNDEYRYCEYLMFSFLTMPWEERLLTRKTMKMIKNPC